MFGYFLRAVAGAAAFLLTALVAGLGMLAPPEPAADAAPAQTLEQNIPKDEPALHVLHTLPSSGLVMQQAADEFAEARGVAVTVQTVAARDDYAAALRARLAAGESAGLFQFFGLRDAMELRPHLAELSALSWLADAVPTLLEPARQNEGVYGVPYSLEGTGILVNVDMFEAVGVDPTRLSTLGALEEAFRALHEKIISGELSEAFPNLEAVTEFAAQDDDYLGDVSADFLLAGAFENLNAVIASQSVTLQDSTAFEELLVLFARFSASRSDWPKLNSVTSNVLLEGGITSGRVAAVLQSAEIYRRVNEVNPALQGRLALIPVPVGARELPVVAIGSPLYWGVRADEDGDADPLALEFLSWLYDTEDGQNILIDRFQALPPFAESHVTSPAAVRRQLLGYLRVGQTIPQVHNELDPRWLDEVFAPGVRRYFGEREAAWEQIEADLTGGWSVDEPPQP